MRRAIDAKTLSCQACIRVFPGKIHVYMPGTSRWLAPAGGYFANADRTPNAIAPMAAAIGMVSTHYGEANAESTPNAIAPIAAAIGMVSTQA